MNIAFIGIGVMGLPMARHLMRGGHKMSVYTRTKQKALPIVHEGAAWHPEIASCVKEADAVITMVGLPSDVEQVYFGAGGIIESSRPGAYLIDMTTTEPELAKRIHSAAKARGLKALDAPVSGGDTGAINATLSIMAGGDEEDYNACLPLFRLMGKTINYGGPAGSGQHTKMANQIAISGCIAGVCEALCYARKAGLDPEKLMASIEKGAAQSWQLTNNGGRILKGDMAPGFYIKHFIKDMSIAQKEADAAGLILPVLKEALKMYRTLEQEGLGEAGTQALIKFYMD